MRQILLFFFLILALVKLSHSSWLRHLSFRKQSLIFRVFIADWHFFKAPKSQKLLPFCSLTYGFQFYGGSLIFLQFFRILLSKRPIALQPLFLTFAAHPNIRHIWYLYNVDTSAVKPNKFSQIKEGMFDLNKCFHTILAVMIPGVSLL